MRVLTVGNMYPPHHQGGYERAWAAVVAGLAAAGHDVRVLTTTHREPGVSSRPVDEAHVRRDLPWYWRDHAFPRRSPRAVLGIERAASAVMRDELASHRPDVVAWFSMGGMPLSLLAVPHTAAVPAAAVVHDEWLAYGPLVDPWTRWTGRLPGPGARLLRSRWRLATGLDARDVDRWSFNSDYVRERAALAGVRPAADRVSVDPPGIDPAAFAPAAPAPEWGGRLLAVGRIVPEKGLAFAVRALGGLAATTLDVVGTGDDDHRRELVRVAAEVGAADRLTFSGSLAGAALRDAYARADAVVFPVTWAEPFGLVPLEAMSVGRPVVATATGGATTYLRHDDNALVVPPADAPAIARAVSALAASAELRERLAAAGARTAETFTEIAFVDAAVRVIEATAGIPVARR